MKRLFALLLVFAMVLALTACSGSKTEPPPASSPTGGGDDGPGSHYIAYSLLGTDWILNYMEQRSAWAVRSSGNHRYDYYSADFSADQMQSNTQSMINAGIEGLVFYPAFATLTPTIFEMCEAAGVGIVTHDIPALDDEQFEIMMNSPVFAGFIASSSYENGYSLGETAARDGYKRALGIANHVGDIGHEYRLRGFEKAFTENGGIYLGEARCANPGEAVQKASDLLNAYPEADCFFSVTGAHTGGVLTALETYNRQDIMVYSIDLDSDLLPYVRAGTMVGNGGAVVATVLSTALLINWLDGHPILDNGKPVYNDYDIRNIHVTAENADDFERCVIKNEILTEDVYRQFLWRYNPDVTYQTYVDFFKAYSLDYLLEMRGEK